MAKRRIGQRSVDRAKARKKAIARADKAMSEYVRARDKHCVICGKSEGLTAGHLITRSKHSVRWDVRNVFCQCRGCNFYHEHNASPFTLWYLRKFGLEAYERLVRDSNVTHKFTIEELDTLSDTFRSAR